MAEELKSKPAVVLFDKMTGRSEHNLDNDSQYQEGAALDLDLGNWNINKPKVPTQTAWQDPERNPRFQNEKIAEDLQPLSPKKVQPKVSMFVDMDKQQGRQDAALEANMAVDLIDGKVDTRIVNEVLKEREEAIRKAKEGPSSKRGVLMLKQQGREDVTKSETQQPLEYSITDALAAIRPRKGKGVNDWNNALGRDQDESGFEASKEELVLSPKESGHSK
jgi:hypothetical protein